MPKAEMESPGLSIRLEAGESSITELSTLAMQMYREASQINATQPLRMGFGSQHIESRWAPEHQDRNYNGTFDPVHAKETQP